MVIVAKRSYHFRDVDYRTVTLDNGKDEIQEILKQEYKVKASTAAQEVPDWVENTDLYKVAIDDTDAGGRPLLVKIG